MKIAIDQGHGAKPKDTGAIGIVNEEAEVRNITPHLADRLRELGHEVKIIDIKSAGSVTESLQLRCNVSNNFDADLFVSMHLNAYQATDKEMGCEVLAISKKAMAIAATVEQQIAKLGFKSRGVKNGDKIYVLNHTVAPAILIESFFVDSIADVARYKAVGENRLGTAIAEAIHKGLGGIVTPSNLTTKPAETTTKPTETAKVIVPAAPIPKVIDILSKCDTGLARGLSLQVIAKINRMVKSPLLSTVDHKLIDVSSPAVNAYLQPRALAALIAAVEERGKTMKINSCYRTTVQQHILREQLKRGLCGLTAVALPGKSNHEKGLAIDIEDAQGWRSYLENQGWSWIGAFDPMHFDYWNGIGELGRLGVSACQLLHNEHHKEQLAVDGSYGDKTAAAINNFPVDGW